MVDPVAATSPFPIRLALRPELHMRDDVRAVAIPAVKMTVSDMLQRLGIPGQPEVSWEQKSGATGRPLKIYANGHPYQYSDEHLLLIHSYARGEHPRSFEVLQQIPDWFSRSPVTEVVQWLTLFCSHTLSLHPKFLFGAEQARAYCLALPGMTAEDCGPVAPVLREILELGISIGDKTAVAEAFKAHGHNALELREHLIVNLNPSRIEVRVERHYLRSLTVSANERIPELFPFLRDGLFAETGVPYGRFQIVVDDDLKPGSFAFGLNHLASIPIVGLPDDLILVNDQPARIQSARSPAEPAITSAEPALIPSTYLPGSWTSRTHKLALEAGGLTTWDAFGHLILSLASDLRLRGWMLVNQSMTQEMLSQFELDYPDLVDAYNAHFTTEELTSILRSLAAQQTPIRNLRRILELLLEHEYFVKAGASLSERIDYLSMGLAHEIAHGHSHGRPLAVYLLDSEFEAALSTREDSDEHVTETLVSAIRAELTHLPPTVRWPPILTNDEHRAPLVAVIADELPRMRILSYSRLPPDLNLQPLARIALTTREANK